MNEERKIKFVEETSSSDGNRKWLLDSFKSISSFEDKVKKDLSEMSAEEAGYALASKDVVSAMTLSNRVSLVVRYKQWCAENGYGSVTVSSGDIHVDISEGIRNTMVCSPDKLSVILPKAFPTDSDRSSKYVYRAYIWLGFAGMYEEDAARVTSRDVSLKEKTIMFNNRWYSFPECAVDDIKHVCEMKYFDRFHEGSVKSFHRADGDEILRGRKLKKQPDVMSYIQNTLNTAVVSGFKNAGFPGISFIKIRKSGLFYEMFKREIIGIPVNFYQVGYDDYIREGKKETAGQTRQKILRRIILMYEKDYVAWKTAFEKELKSDFGLDSVPGIKE